MKIDKQTLMLFGGGLLAGYLICKLMSKSQMSQPLTQTEEQA
jgi:hypothetical protein